MPNQAKARRRKTLNPNHLLPCRLCKQRLGPAPIPVVGVSKGLLPAEFLPQPNMMTENKMRALKFAGDAKNRRVKYI